MGIFFRRSRAANSAVLGQIWLKFELVRDIIDDMVTCKYEEDPIKNEGARVLTRYVFSDAQGQLTKVSGGILPKFELLQAFIVVLVTCKNEEDPIKNEGARVLTRFPHYKSMGIFLDAQGQLTPQSLVESGRNSNSSRILWFSLLEEDPIKNEGARVLTRLYDVFSDAQGQLTPKTAAEFCPNSNSSKLLLS